ncbi:MAG: right-handed parallel beta-helix repeat-containing protein [Methanobacteriota archaeon]
MFIFLILVMPVGVVSMSPVVFPPAPGPYTGDYVYITEPGRYTLEHSLLHQYPVGVIIAAPSVILDGQGYSIQPAVSGANPSVGIWVSLTDSSGRPVTGVTIRNVSITDEGYGIYIEGIDTSEFDWGSNRDGDSNARAAVSSSRSLTLSKIGVSSCRDGIVLQNLSGVALSDIRVSGNSGSGIILNDSQATITDSHLTMNKGYGIQVTGGSGTEISGSTIDGNGEAGIGLDQVNGIRIVNNSLNNSQNIEVGTNCSGIGLSQDQQEGKNIVGGSILGGNYLPDNGVSIPAKTGITNKNGDGIGDLPYDYGIRITDSTSQLKPGDAMSTANKTPSPLFTLDPILSEVLPTPAPTPQSILSGIHAVIISDTIPLVMKSGNAYPVALILYNDGSEDWIEQYNVGIMALEDAASYGPEWLLIPISGPVHSGQTVSLKFTVQAPSKPGIYTLKYQAAREGSGLEVLFGRAYTKTVTVN